MGVERLDPRQAVDVDDVAKLHEEQLGDSPVAMLGPTFIREFYYSALVASGLIDCLVYRLDGRVVAFLSYTKFSADFISRGVRRHPFRLSWVMLRTLLSRPSVLKDIYATSRFLSGGSGAKDFVEGDMIEALSLVVPPEHRRHVPTGGTGRLAVRLVGWMGEQARADSFDRVIYAVQPDNVASNLLFNSLGCEFRKFDCAGKPTYLWVQQVKTNAT